ncbi:MAG: 50S ribosomal protein L9 [bacterium]
MQVILLKDVERLGKKGDSVSVARGYARNYLIPKKLPLLDTPANRRTHANMKMVEKVRLSRQKREAEIVAAQLERVSLTAVVQAGEDDRLFGSVTSKDIAELLLREGFKIDKRKVLLVEPIKRLGVYSVGVKVHPDVEAKIKVWVVRE